MKTTNFKTTALLGLVLFLFACKKDAGVLLTTQEMPKDVLETQQNVTFVSMTKAVDIATAFFATQKDSPVTKSNAKIASTETIMDSKNNNEPMMYVMNYSGGGFVIVSATKDYYPVLAYSDENSFVLKENMDEIGGVVVWLEETQEAIRQSETFDADTKAAIRSSWSRYDPVINTIFTTPVTKGSDPLREAAFQARKTALMNQTGGNIYTYYRLTEAESYLGYDFSWLYGNGQLPGDDEYCIVGVKIDYPRHLVNSLVSTRWDQDDPYNALCNNGQSVAGCCTIALAQIMRSFQHPTDYNWGSMPNTGATIHTQQLIRDIFNHFTILGTSTAITSETIFKLFGYKTTRASHNSSKVRDEILAKQKPIFMVGYPSSGTGHAWVCDGVDRTLHTLTVFVEFLKGFPGSFYYTSLNKPSFYYPEIVHQYEVSLFFRMNWGWNSIDTPDGWFASNDVQTHLGNFYSKRENIYLSQ